MTGPVDVYSNLGIAHVGTTAPTWAKDGDLWFDTNLNVLKIYNAGMKALIAVAALALAGCATGGLSDQAQPRALVTAPAAPSCFILCFVEVVTNTTDEDITSEGGGAITNTTSESEVISGPSMDVGSGTSSAKPSPPVPERN